MNKQIICRNIPHSACKYGANCRYRHTDVTENVTTAFSGINLAEVPAASNSSNSRPTAASNAVSTSILPYRTSTVSTTITSQTTTVSVNYQKSSISQPIGQEPAPSQSKPGSGIVVGTGKAHGNFKAGENIRFVNHKSSYVFNGFVKRGKVSKLLHIYLGQVHKATSTDDILKYSRGVFPSNVFQCERLHVGKKNACFKITAPAHLEKQMYDGKTWPRNTFVRRFYFRKKEEESLIEDLSPLSLYVLSRLGAMESDDDSDDYGYGGVYFDPFDDDNNDAFWLTYEPDEDFLDYFGY